MRYDEEKNIIYVSVKELVLTAKRGVSSYQQYDEDEVLPADAVNDNSVLLSRNITLGDMSFSVFGNLLPGEDGCATVQSRFDGGTRARKQAALSLLQAEAFCLGAMYLNENGGESFSFEACLIEEPQNTSLKQTVTKEKLEAFFNRCIGALTVSGKFEIERVTKRLPSMREAKFPYKKARGGQTDFIHAAYRALAKGSRLYASAPTGTGKTVSALFPAIRALGKGKCSKVFYLTPKTTTALATKNCIELFAKEGIFVRSINLTAKDKLCIFNHECRESKQSCPTYKKNRMSDATLSLGNKNIPCVSADDVVATAKEFCVCPHELALCYSELCDVIICDFNYLFDPDAYIRRYFCAKTDFAFLVDEAHNLPERAREMYSSKITLDEIAPPAILGELSELRGLADGAVSKLLRIAGKLLRDELLRDKDGVESGAYHTKNLPDELYGIFSKLKDAAESELYLSFGARDSEKNERIAEIRAYFHRVAGFLNAILRFDDGFEFFIFKDGERVTLEIFCLDTGAVIDRCLSLGSSAVLFSGTLNPIDYYRSVLGGDRSCDVLEVDSPFFSEQLSVSILNTITTRISEREKSLGAVCSVIAATLSAKRGNYMIFSPSFAYSEALFDAFSKKYPKIKSILQRQNASEAQKREFLRNFDTDDGKYLAAFCVLGGVYSEGIDLVGDKLIGAVIVGIGMPSLSYEREAIAAYYTDKLDSGVEYAYLYPGMNRVLQAAGRVIRSENDRGVIVLIDDRFNDPLYKKIVPKLWRGMKFLPNAKVLREHLDKFWKKSGE